MYKHIPLISVNLCFHNLKFLAWANHQTRKLIYHTQKQGTVRCELLICSEVPKQMFEHFPKHTFIECKQGETIGNKRNMLLEKSKGDFICLVDSDDLQFKYRIKLQLDLMEMLKEKNVDITTTDALYCYNTTDRRSYYIRCQSEGALFFRRNIVDENRRFGTGNLSEGLPIVLEKNVYFENTHYLIIALQHSNNTADRSSKEDMGDIDEFLDDTEKELIKDLI